jgi:hypothetical protein
MDKRYKHLNGEERGVILRSTRAGRALGRSGHCWGAAPRPSGGNCVGAVRRETLPSRIARKVAGTDTGRAASSVDGG